MSQDNVIIELKGLTKRYGYGDTESFALKDFDFTIKRGEFIMVMGPSGCGKTTLLNIIGLLDRPSRGEYYLNGESVANISAGRQAKLRAKKIGFIFQNFNLIDNLSVIENVSLPLIYSGYSQTSRLKTASSILERFNLQKREYYLPHQLSGGQQQHVAIARAIVGSPEIILADEPTGNLDSRASRGVMDVLKSIHEEGNTIIMVTHNPALTTYATRVIYMLDGHIDTDVKTVADRDLPQPIEVKIKKRHKDSNQNSATEQIFDTDSKNSTKSAIKSTTVSTTKSAIKSTTVSTTKSQSTASNNSEFESLTNSLKPEKPKKPKKSKSSKKSKSKKTSKSSKSEKSTHSTKSKSHKNSRRKK